MTTSAAGITDNRSILAKADLALGNLTAEGGMLLPAQAAKFIRIMTKTSKLLGMCTVTPMRAQNQYVEKIRFKNRVLRAGQSATALAPSDRSKPDLGRVELAAKLFKAEVWLDNETLEDSIERGELRQTIMQLLAEAVARDTEDVVINGDLASSDTLLAQLDGIIKQAQSHKVDNASGSPAVPQPPARSIFKRMMQTMPSQFLRDKKALVHLTSVNAEIAYRDTLADRATVGGDKYVEQDVPSTAFGIKVEDIPLFPENLGAANDCTNIILTDPKNINVGIWRNIRVETDKDISAGVLKIVVSLRFDVKFIEEDAVVRAYNVKVA